jgi:hypothetical protein
VTATRVSMLAAALILAGLALWWRYGLIIAIADPAWFCLSR